MLHGNRTQNWLLYPCGSVSFWNSWSQTHKSDVPLWTATYIFLLFGLQISLDKGMRRLLVLRYYTTVYTIHLSLTKEHASAKCFCLSRGMDTICFHLVSIRGHLYRRVLTEDDSFFEVSHIACKIDYLNGALNFSSKIYIHRKSHGTHGLILNFK